VIDAHTSASCTVDAYPLTLPCYCQSLCMIFIELFNNNDDEDNNPDKHTIKIERVICVAVIQYHI